ncbi:MAG: hypothetical protein ABR583_11110 [Gaiellaceae bacterium]
MRVVRSVIAASLHDIQWMRRRRSSRRGAGRLERAAVRAVLRTAAFLLNRRLARAVRRRR